MSRVNKTISNLQKVWDRFDKALKKEYHIQLIYMNLNLQKK